MTDERPEGWLAETTETAERIRSTPSSRRLALLTASIAGIGLSLVHWVGLVVGGALVGLTRPRLRSAVLVGAGFGLLTVGLTVLLGGPELMSMLRPVSYGTAAVGIVLPVWGSLVRYAL